MLRAARVIRAARLFTLFPSLRIILTATLSSLPAMGPPAALLLFLLMLTALFGQNQLAGLTYTCNRDSAPLAATLATTRSNGYETSGGGGFLPTPLPDSNASSCTGFFTVTGDRCSLLPTAVAELCCRSFGGLSAYPNISSPEFLSSGGAGNPAQLVDLVSLCLRTPAATGGSSTQFKVPALWSPFPANFKDFPSAMLSSFEIMVGENWPAYVRVYMSSTTPHAASGTGTVFMVIILAMGHMASKILCGVMLYIFYASRNKELGMSLLTPSQVSVSPIAQADHSSGRRFHSPLTTQHTHPQQTSSRAAPLGRKYPNCHETECLETRPFHSLV